MSALVNTLYPLPDLRRTPLSLFRWWESRRWLYNQVVGAAGLVTLFTVFLFSALTGVPAPAAREALVIALAYGTLANACYSLGWFVEIGARVVWGAKAPDLGPLLFREGLIFSVGLTLLPILMTGLLAVVRLGALILG